MFPAVEIDGDYPQLQVSHPVRDRQLNGARIDVFGALERQANGKFTRRRLVVGS